MDTFGRKLFSFGRSKATKKNDKTRGQTQRNKEQEILEFADENFDVQHYISSYYTRTTPDKAPDHIDKLQSLLNNTNDLLKSYVYDNHTAFVHASNRTLAVENDVVFLHSLINNLKLSINTLPNETISSDPASRQTNTQHDEIGIFGGKGAQNLSFFLAGADNAKSNSDNSLALISIDGLYDKNNIMRIKMIGNVGKLEPKSPTRHDDDEVNYFHNKYINKGKTTETEGNDIEMINLVEMAEDLRSLIFERRLGEAVNLVEVFVLLGIIPPILQFNQTTLDAQPKSPWDKGGAKGSQARFSGISQDNNILPKKHYTSFDYIDPEIIPSTVMLGAAEKASNMDVTTSIALNSVHARHRTIMQQSIMHENISYLVNPPQFFKPVITTPAINLTTNDTYNKNFYQRQQQSANHAILSQNDADTLSKPRAFETGQSRSYNDGQYTFQPVLSLPMYRPKIMNKTVQGDSSGLSSYRDRGQQQGMTLQQVEACCPQPKLFATMFGFAKQAPSASWRHTHQQETISRQRSDSRSGQLSPRDPNYNSITINDNKVEKNTNITHHYSKQTELSTHIGHLVTTLATILLDEMTDFVGTQWEQDVRVQLLCRLNQHHLALHRFLALQSKHLQEQLRKAKYKGDLHIFTLSICHIVFGTIQHTIREFKRLFSSPKTGPGSRTTPSSGQINSFFNALTKKDDKSSTTDQSLQLSNTIVSLLTDQKLGIPTNPVQSVMRDDLLSHLSTWILLEITRLGKFIDIQVLQQDDKFTNFPLCINAVYQASLETEQSLGITTCNVLVRCLQQSILSTINNIVNSIDKDVAENVLRDDWSPIPLNFTLPPVSLQTPKDLLSPEALEMIESNIKVTKIREERLRIMTEYKEKLRALKRAQKEGGKMIQSAIIEENSKLMKEEEGSDSDELSALSKKYLNKSKTASITANTTTSKNSSSTTTTVTTTKDTSTLMKEIPLPKLPELSPDEDIIHDKIRLYVSNSAVYVYQVLLTFSKQLLSVLLCPIWRVSQQSIEAVAIDVLCNCVENAIRGFTSLIRKHLATLWAPLPPDFQDFATAMTNTASHGAQLLMQKIEKQNNQQEKEKANEKNGNLLQFLTKSNATQSSTLLYKQDPSSSPQAQNKSLSPTGQNGTTVTTVTPQLELPNQPLKKEFKPLSELQLAVIVNSLSFISHYIFPYISLLMSVNLCKPIPELLSNCYKQKQVAISAFAHVTKKKAAFLIRGRWFAQQSAQYRELLEQQRAILSKHQKYEEIDQAKLDSLIAPPNYKEDFDNINTLHAKFNGAMFWCDSDNLQERYTSLPEFPEDKPSLESITTYMLQLLTHIYQQWLSYGQVFTPHQSKLLLLSLTDEILTLMLQPIGWEKISPTRSAACYMICDFKTMLYFCYALFGVNDDVKTKRESLLRRITKLYGKRYAEDRPETYLPRRTEKAQVEGTKDAPPAQKQQNIERIGQLLNDETFLNNRLKEIDLGTDYYKSVAKQLLDHCRSEYSQKLHFNCQAVQQ